MQLDEFDIIHVRPDMSQVKTMAGIASVSLVIIGNFVYSVVWERVSFTITGPGVFMFFGLLLLGGLIHEIVHVLGFLFLTDATKEDIRMGLSNYMPFVHCKRPVRLQGFRWAILLPTILVGFMPLIIGIKIQSLMVTNLSCLLTAGGMGDVIGFIYLVRFPGNALVYDYPDELGCDVYIPSKK